MDAATRTAPPSPGWSLRFRQGYLLAALLLYIFGRPFFGDSVLGLAVIDLLLLITLVAGVVAVIEYRRQRLAAGALALLTIVLFPLWKLTDSEPLLLAALGSALGFQFVVAGCFVQALFRRQDHVTIDTLFAAVAAYLLFGVAWSFAFAMLELAAPGSFAVAGAQPFDPARFDRFLGFSFITLTTLGYGNVAPASPQADALATFEAVVGQIYLAVVIARLVGLHVAQDLATRPN
jgi:voltage-gated potassium channel